MTEPVAEEVERLRWYARHYFSHVPRYETLTLDRCMSINEMLATAADEIERLSREKEAGEFWSGVFSEITDKTEREKIAAELTDFHFMMDQVPQVYMHITGGRMSKTNYYAADVIAEADDYAQECFRKDTDAEIEPLKAEIERLSRERDTADEHFVVINGPDGACVEVVSGRDRLVETCRNILWSGEGDVPEDVLAILDTVGNPDADEWTEHGAPARLRFDFEDGALEILRVNFMPRAVSRERDTGVPEGWQDDVPAGAIDNGRELLRRLVDNYDFQSEGGPLRNCSEFQDAIRCFEAMAEWISANATLTRERDQAREALAKCEDLIFWIESTHERIQASIDWQKAHPNATAAEKSAFGATWRPTADRMQREIDDVVARVRARSVLQPEKEAENG